ncbi:hypothetical protein [Psychromicrobium xiongbiense]|uniref:hypothetical protein n=1 Tax=Psychromicrobium xiongbiense TaxID=3051184 RepID=UPI0025577ED0|nr:hypothetical protein [Psychromicrobium sp. YIM S02556]
MSRRSARHALLWVFSTALVAVLAVVAGLWAMNFFTARPVALSVGCSASTDAGTFRLAPDQTANASLISSVALRRNLPPRAVTIALAVAMQESKIRNITYGDLDSVGLFQQRPSQGWGTKEQILNPEYAINAFYNALLKVPNYQSMAVTDAGQAVQRSAFPLAYGQHEPMARAFASALTGNSTGNLSCTLNPPSAAGTPADVEAALRQNFGSITVQSTPTGVRISSSGSYAWAMAQWAVANAQSLNLSQVSFAGENWICGNNDGATNRGWVSGGVPSDTEVIITVQKPS